MTDAWFYCPKNGETSGPVSTDELIRVLSKYPKTGDILVWAVGFEDWRKPQDVPGLAALFTPPPLPTNAGVIAKWKPSFAVLGGVGLGAVLVGAILVFVSANRQLVPACTEVSDDLVAILKDQGIFDRWVAEVSRPPPIELGGWKILNVYETKATSSLRDCAGTAEMDIAAIKPSAEKYHSMYFPIVFEIRYLEDKKKHEVALSINPERQKLAP